MYKDLYASILELDRRAVKALRITDPYSLHRVVYSLFEDMRTQDEKDEGVPSGILYADEGGDFRKRRVIMLSDRKPLSCVPEGYGIVRTKRIPDGFLECDWYRFKVTLNPCRRNNTTRKIVPVKGREKIREWFCGRAVSSWGFSVSLPQLQVDAVNVLRFKGKNGNPITISTARLQGVLKVEERDRFVKSFSNGIGRARAFGCGLLQIVPLR